MINLTNIEILYYNMLKTGELFKLDNSFTGYISEDWELFLTHYIKLNG